MIKYSRFPNEASGISPDTDHWPSVLKGRQCNMVQVYTLLSVVSGHSEVFRETEAMMHLGRLFIMLVWWAVEASCITVFIMWFVTCSVSWSWFHHLTLVLHVWVIKSRSLYIHTVQLLLVLIHVLVRRTCRWINYGRMFIFRLTVLKNHWH